jgi:hypothetical protein
MFCLRQWVTFGMFLVLGANGLGCCHGEPREFDKITVSLSDSMKEGGGVFPSVQVDVVAVNNVDLPAWQQKSMTDYFTAHDPMRESADKHVFRLGGGGPQSATLSFKDGEGKALWKKWMDQGASTLLVLSSYPSPQADLPGDQDPRRRTLPLGCDRWDNSVKEIKVQVKPSGLSVLTPPNPPKQ